MRMTLSEYIVLDKIVERNSEKYVHFLTHATDKLQVPNNWKSLIYTSKAIVRLMTSVKCNIPIKCFQQIALNDPVTITLDDGKSFKVTMFRHEGVLGNVMYYFEDTKFSVLYTGPFITCRTIYLNTLFRTYVDKKVDYLFIDNSRASSPDEISIEAACSAILDISRKLPEHQILINIPPLGYEDFIVSLVKIANLKVYINAFQFIIFEKLRLSQLFESDYKTAKVIIGNETLYVENVLKRFKKDKIITVQLVNSRESHQNYFQQIGLYQVQWSPHPSLLQLYAFIEFVKPKQVLEIFINGPKLPLLLKDNCERPLNIEERLSNICNGDTYIDLSTQPFLNLNEFVTSTQKNNVSQSKEPDGTQGLVSTFSSLDLREAESGL